MLHPRLTPVGQTIGGSASRFLGEIGDYGSWSDLQLITRWGEGASGNFELSWKLPLTAGFEHPLLRRGTIVELMDGSWRLGSPFVMAEPSRGSGIADPWQIVCAGIGREVEGENAWFCDDGSGNTTSIASTAITTAIADGLPWAGYDSTVSTVLFGGTTNTDELMTIGSLLNAYGDSVTKRWRVGQDNKVGFLSDPTTPTYMVAPDTVALGTADDDYATVVKVRYLDSATSTYKTSKAPSTASATQTRFGRREFAVNLIGMGAIATATADSISAGILAKTRGRLAYTNGLTLSSNEILTAGGTPADLSKVAEDVANGCMVRIHGVFSDLLDYNGQTYLDVVIGEAKYVDGAQTIDLAPLGLAKRDLAGIVESVSGYKENA